MLSGINSIIVIGLLAQATPIINWWSLVPLSCCTVEQMFLPSLLGMYGLPRPWYFPLQRSYWSGSGRVETWDWPWCGGGAARLSVMEEDQACAMDHRRTGMDRCSFGWQVELLEEIKKLNQATIFCRSTQPSQTLTHDHLNILSSNLSPLLFLFYSKDLPTV